MESQIEESISNQPPAARSAVTLEESQRRRKLADLQLSRSRVLQSLEASASERYSNMLRQALAELDLQIAALSE